VAEGADEGRQTARRLIPPALAVTALSLVLYGWPAPRLSEELYLPLVKRAGDPDYLRGDWTFSGAFPEHWVFNHLLAPLGRALPIEVLGWVGRLATWPLLAYLLVGLVGRLRIRPWAAAGAVMLWLVANQAVLGGEWILGTFEAKTVAYCFLLGALHASLSGRVPLALVLLGTTLALHPAVGLWGAWAGSIALLALPETRRATLRWCWLGLCFAAPGLVEGFAAIGPATDALRQFVVLVAIPYHTDPFFGGTTAGGWQAGLRIGLLLAMFAANLWAFRRSSRDLAQRYLAAFQIAAAVPFALGIVARVLGLWSFLQLMPFRSFPLFVPLVFFAQVVRLASESWHTGPAPGTSRRARRRAERSGRRRAVGLVSGAAFIALLGTAPLLAAPRMAARNLAAWTGRDDEGAAFEWIRENTTPSTRCIVSVDRQDAFSRTQRPLVANWQAIRYDDLAAWKRRVVDLVGSPATFDGPGWTGDLEHLRDAYAGLDATQVERIARRYDATCLVSTTHYPFPVRHREGDVRIYRIDKGGRP